MSIQPPKKGVRLAIGADAIAANAPSIEGLCDLAKRFLNQQEDECRAMALALSGTVNQISAKAALDLLKKPAQGSFEEVNQQQKNKNRVRILDFSSTVKNRPASGWELREDDLPGKFVDPFGWPAEPQEGDTLIMNPRVPTWLELQEQHQRELERKRQWDIETARLAARAAEEERMKVQAEQTTAATEPAPAAPPEAVLRPSPAVPAVAESWHIKEPERAHGYTLELYRVLKAAHDAGQPRPKARDVLDSWAASKPHNILEVMADGFKYMDSNGDPKLVDLNGLRTAINRMTSER